MSNYKFCNGTIIKNWKILKKVDKGEKKHAQYEVENIHTKEIKVMSSNVLSILNIRRGKNTKSGRPTAK